MARSISALGNPMLSMFWMAASRWAPSVRAEGSLKLAGSVDALEPAGAGVGVAGAFAVVVFNVWAGAAGGAGVWAVAGAGVEGAFALAEAAAGGALGYVTVRTGLQPFGSSRK